VIPAAFDYARPDSLDAALALLTEHGDEAKLLAGGHSLLPLMKLRLAMPEVLIDVAGLPELRGVRVDGDQLVLGAGLRHAELERDPTVAAEAPLLAHVAGRVGDPQVRHRGTLGGSVAHGDPASDLPTALLALDAVVIARSVRESRSIPLTEFYRGFLETALGPDEVVTEIRVPRTRGFGWGYEKFTRRENDWPIVAVAAVEGPGGARVALANVGSTVLRAPAVEDALRSGEPVGRAAERTAEGLDPPSDMHADAEYRRHLARLLTRRALESALRATVAG
jgi:carbon-monoxide dehydrogenase medium subunit